MALAGVAQFSQTAAPPRQPLQKIGYIGPPRASSDVKESRPLENSVKLSHPDDERETAVARVLKTQEAPSDRVTYFQSVLKNPDFHFRKWGVVIHEVKVVDGVMQVEVYANPQVTSHFGGATVIVDCLKETYELNGDNLKLLKTDPPVDPTVVKQFGFQVW